MEGGSVWRRSPSDSSERFMLENYGVSTCKCLGKTGPKFDLFQARVESVSIRIYFYFILRSCLESVENLADNGPGR